MILSTYEQKHDTIQLSCEIAHYNMRQLSIQRGAFIYTVLDTFLYSIGHQSHQYIQYGTSHKIVSDIYLYSTKQ